MVVSKIEDFRGILQNPRSERPEKQRALKYLIHFITDLHQPMHVGDNGDKGGNLLQLRFFNLGTNLHRIWDTQIMERYSNNEEQWLRELRRMVNQKNVAEWSKAKSVTDWATESLAIAKTAYRAPGTEQLLKPGTKLGEDYYRFALPIVQEQLEKAGIRVAAILNEIFR
jgi:hypothetical protein